MMIVYLALSVLAAAIVVRYLLLLFFAEIGRRQDLIKHIYKSGTDFYLAIVIPFADSRKVGALRELIQALEKQDYPASRVGIHVIATQESMLALPNAEDLSTRLKVWTYPARQAPRGQLIAWLIERLLAAGGPSRLFVFLEADDIVRPDFLRNVTTRAYDCFVTQGYVALKRPPQGILASVVALSTRFINRIENAGRYHLGLSCKLMNSCWVIRQEILEMIPYRQGIDLDNIEYTTLLHLHGYRINWAPNVVVYREDRVQFAGLMKTIAYGVINRLRLAVQYVPQLLLLGITRMDLALFEQAWTIVKPPHFILGLLGVGFALALYYYPVSPSGLYGWSLLLLAFWTTQLIQLGVARCSFRDVLVFLAATPLVYLAGLVTFPLFLLGALGDTVFRFGDRPQRVRIGKRFDETKPSQPSKYAAKLRSLPPADTKTEAEAADEGFETIYQRKLQSVVAEEPSMPPSHREREKPNAVFPLPQQLTEAHTRVLLPVSNGVTSVDCLLHIFKAQDAQGEDVYSLTFEYKNLSFTSQQYRILDQAYYELQTKLGKKGMTILSCGSCAYFYRPTVGNAYGVAKDHGFCLFGKLGRDIQVDTDAVTVVSPTCREYTDMQFRQQFLQAWQESLSEHASVS